MLESMVTVVLTAYKRIDTLDRQLEAIKNQSIKPAQIWLFQDCIPKDYNITINRDLLDKFDKMYIAKQNQGVWGRFNYARNVETEYVCIFDDDTIPGSQWLENCLNEMNKREGIYGTIGVIFTEPARYTHGGHYRIGWDRPNEDTKEVDLVGHSWFLKTAWLEYMFDLMPDYSKKYKYCGEDMSLSYACLEKGIQTYVPPHPVNNMEQWGSMPYTANSIGKSAAALSFGENKNTMNVAALEMVSNGWNILVKRRPDYVKNGLRQERRYLNKLRVRNFIRRLKRLITLFR